MSNMSSDDLNMEMVLPRSPALTICIPTYNRGKRVHALVLFLKRNLLPLTDDVEILVVNNCSDDGTREMIQPLAEGPVKLFNRTEFLDTAELNMFHSLKLCSGDFVWYHGDDDIPAVETILDLISMIRQDAADLYVFNSPVINDEGGVLCRQMASMRTSHLDVSADALIETAGFVFMLAGISNVIFRREYADIEVAWEAQAIQPLYVHVCWFLACFAQHRTRIVNRPLVYYRNSEIVEQIAHFKRVAVRKNVADQYFWGVGIALQLKWLVERGVISASSLPRIFEGRRDGTRFRLLSECIHKIYTQVVESIGSTEERFRVPPAVLADIRDFFVSCDLFIYDIFEPIEKLNEIARGERSHREIEELKQTFNRIHHLHEVDVYRSNWQADRYGYQIYRMACQWVAVRQEVHGGITKALSFIDLQEQAPYLLVGDDFDTLVLRAAEYAKKDTLRTARSNQSLVEMQQLARQHVELMQRALHEYTHSVQIYRQATLWVRKLTQLSAHLATQLRPWGRRLLVKRPTR